MKKKRGGFFFKCCTASVEEYQRSSEVGQSGETDSQKQKHMLFCTIAQKN